MIKLSKKLEQDAQTLAWYINGVDLESALEQAAYDLDTNGQTQSDFDAVQVIKRALEIANGEEAA